MTDLILLAEGAKHRPLAVSNAIRECQSTLDATRDGLCAIIDRPPGEPAGPGAGDAISSADPNDQDAFAAAVAAGEREMADPECEPAYAVFGEVPAAMRGRVAPGEVVAMPPSEFEWWRGEGVVRAATPEEIRCGQCTQVRALRRRLWSMSSYSEAASMAKPAPSLESAPRTPGG